MDNRTAPAPAAPAVAGIPLRDWFAGQAINAIVMAPRVPGVPRLEMDGMAKQAYEFADAMMRARGG